MELTPREMRLLRHAMIEFRNIALERGLPTEDIDAILARIYRL